MKKAKRFISIALTAGILLSAISVTGFAYKANDKLKQQYNNKYPFVFVHGLNGWGAGEGINSVIPYWGATCGDLMDYLGENGYDCYSSSVGPISSAWDRACELYAELTGTTVDYGAAHSAKYNHKRFGRTYDKPLFEGWGKKGTDGAIEKIHLIGHSFGGTTVRMLAYLMTYGCKEETAAANGGKISPLFTGGKESWIYSVTTICTPHNSSSIYYFTKSLNLFDQLFVLSAMYAGAAGRTVFNGRTVDFHLEQFGLTNTPGEYDADLYFRALKRYVDNCEDSCQYNLTPEGTQEINDMIKISPNIYYYSYAFCATHTDKLTGLTVPDALTNPVLSALGLYMGNHKTFTDEYTGQVYDENWKDSDLMANTISETYPFDEPHRDYDGKQITGVWNVMPIQQGDHGQAVGLLANKTSHRKFYLDLAQMLVGLEK